MKKLLALLCAFSLIFSLVGCSLFGKEKETYTLPGVDINDVSGLTTRQNVIDAIGVTLPKTKMVTKTTDANYEKYTLMTFGNDEKLLTSYSFYFFNDEASYNDHVSKNVGYIEGNIVAQNLELLMIVNHDPDDSGTEYGTFESLSGDNVKIIK